MPKPELVTKHKPQTNLLRAASFYSSINASNNPQTLLHLFSFFPNNFQKRNWRLYQDLNSDRRSRRWACWPLDNHHCPNVHNFGSIKNGLKLGTWCCLSCGQRPYLLLQQSKFEFHWRSTTFFLVILLNRMEMNKNDDSVGPLKMGSWHLGTFSIMTADDVIECNAIDFRSQNFKILKVHCMPKSGTINQVLLGNWKPWSKSKKLKWCLDCGE